MKKITLVIAVLVAAAAAASLAYAAIPSANGTISACKSGDGDLKVIDVEAGQTCKASQKLLTWNQQGPQGPIGPQGPAGTISHVFDAEGGGSAVSDNKSTLLTTSWMGAGTWLVEAKINVEQKDAAFEGIYLFCELAINEGGGSVLDVLYDYLTLDLEGANNDQIVLSAKVVSDGNDSAKLSCADTGKGDAYWSNARLSGVKVG